MTLAHFDNQRVQFVGVACSFFAGRTRYRAVTQGLQFRIARVGGKKFMARDHPPQIFVHYKYGMFESVQQDRIRGLRADAG